MHSREKTKKQKNKTTLLKFLLKIAMIINFESLDNLIYRINSYKNVHYVLCNIQLKITFLHVLQCVIQSLKCPLRTFNQLLLA